MPSISLSSLLLLLLLLFFLRQAELYSAKKHSTPGALAFTPSSLMDDAAALQQSRSEEAMLVLRQALQEVQVLEHRAKTQTQTREESSCDTPTEGLPVIARLLQVLWNNLTISLLFSSFVAIYFLLLCSALVLAGSLLLLLCSCACWCLLARCFCCSALMLAGAC
jgi:hypothetical protein